MTLYTAHPLPANAPIVRAMEITPQILIYLELKEQKHLYKVEFIDASTDRYFGKITIDHLMGSGESIESGIFACTNIKASRSQPFDMPRGSVYQPDMTISRMIEQGDYSIFESGISVIGCYNQSAGYGARFDPISAIDVVSAFSRAKEMRWNASHITLGPLTRKYYFTRNEEQKRSHPRNAEKKILH
jgi:hypothetical protein